MSDLLFARLQMAVSLGFHIVFAAVGMAMPVLMVLAEWRHLRTGNDEHKALAKRWAKGTAVFFAIGAVSGTVLSFELGLLWPAFMEHAGGIIGVPFGLEGFAFFTEAIFLGVYLYAWDRINKWAHLAAGVIVAISGSASAVFIIMVNGWMNAPAGFDFDPETGVFSNIDPVAAMLNEAWLGQAVHMILAAMLATSMAVAGIHAIGLLRNRESVFHRRALGVAMTLAVPTAILQPMTGHFLAQEVVERQPAKFAAMEAQFHTEQPAPMRIGGWVDGENQRVVGAIEIPRLLSFLATNDFNAEVRGLDQIPRDQWPPVAIVHYAFDIMVACGLVMLAVCAWFAISFVRTRRVDRASTPLLRAIALCIPLGFIAIEAGWTVTEVGRQPWVIHEVMRTADAVTPMPGLWAPFLTFTLVYLLLGAIVAKLFVDQVRSTYHPPAHAQ